MFAAFPPGLSSDSRPSSILYLVGLAALRRGSSVRDTISAPSLDPHPGLGELVQVQKWLIDYNHCAGTLFAECAPISLIA